MFVIWPFTSTVLFLYRPFWFLAQMPKAEEGEKTTAG